MLCSGGACSGGNCGLVNKPNFPTQPTNSTVNSEPLSHARRACLTCSFLLDHLPPCFVLVRSIESVHMSSVYGVFAPKQKMEAALSSIHCQTRTASNSHASNAFRAAKRASRISDHHSLRPTNQPASTTIRSLCRCHRLILHSSIAI